MSVKVTPAQYEIVLSQAEYDQVSRVVLNYTSSVIGTYMYDLARHAAEALGIDIEEAGY